MYQALYRKYRPVLFRDVVGQKNITRILQNSILNNKIGHAYLFYGPRGTGKTSLAKIFARTINCEHLKNGEMCGKCSSCIAIDERFDVDIIEIDAASNNGVDEIRELKNKINLVPNTLKYKVYIIDEVHMMSIGAFNALLKTLEEPPNHIVFILATTDPQKVPETIKSRCQCFQFNRLTNKEIVNKLKKIATLEKINIDDNVLEKIAIASNGGMRDSLSMLDMLFSSIGNNVTFDDFIEVSGLISDEDLFYFYQKIIEGNVNECLNCLDKFYDNGQNIIYLCEMLLQMIRDTIVDAYRNNLVIDKKIEKLAFFINERMFDIKKSSNPKIYLDMLILKFLKDNSISQKNISREIIADSFEQNGTEDAPTIDKQKLVKIKDKKNGANLSINNNLFEEYVELFNIRANNVLVDADKNKLNEIKKMFEKLDEYKYNKKYGHIVTKILDGKIAAASEYGIIMTFAYKSIVDSNIDIYDDIIKILDKLLHYKNKICFLDESTWNILKQEYIQKRQVGEKYVYIDEPTINMKKINNKESIVVSSAKELFGELVEEE